MSNYRYIDNFTSFYQLGETFDFQFVAFVYSTWHLDNVIANMHLYSLDSGLIIVLPSVSRRFIAENFNHSALTKCHVVEVGKYSVRSSYKNLYRFLKRNKQSKLVIFNSLGIDIRLLLSLPLNSRDVNLVIYDEGTGSYCSPYYLKKNRYRTTFSAYLIITFIELLKLIARILLDIKVSKSLLFIKSNGLYYPNVGLVKQLRDVYINYEHVKLDIPIIQNSVIFFKDLDFNDLEFYKDLFDQIGSSKTIYVKLHPSHQDPTFIEFLKRYNSIVIPNTISGEYAVSILKPSYIIGGLSTILYTSSVLYDIQVISLFDLYVSRDFIKKNTIYFKLNNSIGRNLNIVKNINEIIRLIK